MWFVFGGTAAVSEDGLSRAMHENHEENDILYGTYHWGTITRNELNMSHKPRADFNKNGVNRHRGL